MADEHVGFQTTYHYLMAGNHLLISALPKMLHRINKLSQGVIFVSFKGMLRVFAACNFAGRLLSPIRFIQGYTEGCCVFFKTAGRVFQRAE